MAGDGDDDQDVEEEEYLVHVEFDGLLDPNILDRPNLFFKVIGIETEKPLMQIEEQVFMGEYRDVGGTALFFEKDPSPKVDDPVFGKNQDFQLQYVCKTRKSLLMSRVFLKPKGQNDSDEESGEDRVSDEENIEEIEVPDEEQSQESAPRTSNFEPVPGPSWAPDIPVVAQKQTPEKSADHVSRLIAEQMTIASDIEMQNSLVDSD